MVRLTRIKKDRDWNVHTVYLGSPFLEYTKGAVFLQHGDAAIRLEPTGRADARKNRKTSGSRASQG